MVEGKLRCEELAKFLEEHKARKIIWSSEDATAIIATCKYDPKTNQIVGVLLPTNKEGCPIPLRWVFLFIMNINTKNALHIYCF